MGTGSARSAAQMAVTQSFPLQVGWKEGDSLAALIEREWLVTNGLGGYASGTIGGACSRRFHGNLIAALPPPFGRTMMLNHLEEMLELPGYGSFRLSGDEPARSPEPAHPEALAEFFLDGGLPVWRFNARGVHIEKRLLMPYLQNSTYLMYRLVDGPRGAILRLTPSLRFRPHEGRLDGAVPHDWRVRARDQEIEISDGTELPPLRLATIGDARFERRERELRYVLYRVERSRGYDWEGPLWSPGTISVALEPERVAGLVVSVEPWPVLRALSIDEAIAAETSRRSKLLTMAGRAANDEFSAQLVLAADQFLIRPGNRSADDARLRAAGDDPRTVIAGYHWFTDWGRDTMISLEGLTLTTGRHREAGSILRTFASYIRDGLIPNHFPEGDAEGLYHTADATMWFFHAVKRYADATGDRETLRALLPQLVDIIEHHVEGTRFNIGVDPSDGLLQQGASGYQLTWMDAKMGDWVVTPRRGKAVEINALFYNALRITQHLLEETGDKNTARRIAALADRAYESFNRRFWYEKGQHLFDVVDSEGIGDDSSLRPNQIFAVSLDYPVLERARWDPVVDAVRRELLTPVGLRSLSQHHVDYKPTYDGDLRTRDGAYHQGTVWGWLIGPFVDAWLRVHPEDRAGALSFLAGFRPHLGEACIGTISEIFDAEPPFHARGCAAQAWSVAEVLRCLSRVRA